MTLQLAIQGVLDSTPPNSKQRNKALKSIEWRLRSPAGQYAGLEGLRCVLTDAEHAQTFDGRDSEGLKLKYYSLVLKTPFEIELISFGQ